MLDRLDERARTRVSGPTWDRIRPNLERVHSALVAASPDARGTLTTIYIKYTSPETGEQPYAVLWVKKSSELILGLALPEDFEAEALTGPASGIKYKGLTKFVRLTPDSEVPSALSNWIAAAVDQTKAIA